jgi:type IV pilus assembly protein PilA
MQDIDDPRENLSEEYIIYYIKIRNIIMNTKSKKGFTLVEIMIVVVIIGLLAAMAIPAFQKVRTTAQEKTILNNLRQLASGAEQYFLEEGVTTVASATLVADGSYVKSFSPVASGGDSYTDTITTALDALTASHPSGTGTISIGF